MPIGTLIDFAQTCQKCPDPHITGVPGRGAEGVSEHPRGWYQISLQGRLRVGDILDESKQRSTHPYIRIRSALAERRVHPR
jgi:hypothetical protein